MRRLIQAHGPCTLRRRRHRDPFVAVVRSIVSQMISGAAARTVNDRLVGLLGGDPSPARVLRLGAERLREAGLSGTKARAIHTLAVWVDDGSLDFERIKRLPAARVKESLIAVPGIGEWTANMFLMFHLARPDVFPSKDLGIQEGLRRAYGLRARPKPAEAARRAERWAPYRSTAAWYLWRALDGDAEI